MSPQPPSPPVKVVLLDETAIAEPSTERTTGRRGLLKPSSKVTVESVLFRYLKCSHKGGALGPEPRLGGGVVVTDSRVTCPIPRLTVSPTPGL
jgi:hypothetical protein